jgi:PAS domain S-box-containing protein
MYTQKDNLAKLREKAVDKVDSERLKLKGLVTSEPKHELDVHKMELEMQYDELLSAQSKLLKSNEEYTELFNHAPVSYFILDKDGVVINVNNSAIELLGKSKKQLVGKHLALFINSKSHQDAFYLHKNYVIDGGKKHRLECDIKKSDGIVFYGLIESALIKDENENFKYLITTVTDVTSREIKRQLLENALNKERELNELKSQFITIASHEFRTPLATILMSTELIEKYDLPVHEEKKKNHFKKIKNSVSRMKEILIDFLSASEIEKGMIKNNPEVFNLSKYTEAVIEETKSFNGIHTIKYTHIGESQNVYLDKKILKTCLSNLIINAYKYSPKGGEIEVITELKKDGSLSFKVKDNGIGIPKKDELHIFENFFRAKNAENIQGTGIGLNITRRLVTIMGGDITFISTENKGSTFTIKFKNGLKK